MRDKIDDIRKTLKSHVGTEWQAKKLAQVAAAALAPEAMKMERRLVDAFRAIPKAGQLRGESEAARQAALDALEEAVKEADAGAKKDTGEK